ncbi:SRPBCC family protein [Streptomyces sp. NPDC060194]|uniref:SRPBCC family protein n=1 Tax=Streptomyces sp. NPDC060194 TaxID=3347069 RepID=UPI0036648075
MSSSLVETVDIEAPVAVAWELWSDVTRWPRFLSHVSIVEPLGDRLFAWKLSLPGAEKNFVAELTEVVEEDRIAWRTTEGVHHAGVVTFHRLSATTSRVTLQIEYDPHGFVERLGALTNLDSVLANYDLGEFQKLAELRAAALAGEDVGPVETIEGA